MEQSVLLSKRPARLKPDFAVQQTHEIAQVPQQAPSCFVVFDFSKNGIQPINRLREIIYCRKNVGCKVVINSRHHLSPFPAVDLRFVTQ